MVSQPQNQPTFPTAPDARAYRHQACGSDTTVTGNDFRRLTNPKDVAQQTFCARCRRLAPFAEFAWADTGESLAAYRARLTALPPLSKPRNNLARWGLALGTPLILGGLGELATSTAAHAERGVGFAMGAMLGFFVGVAIVLVMNRANPVDYRGYR